VCIGLLGIAFWSLWDLSSRTDHLDARVDVAARDAVEINAAAQALLARSDSLESRVESLEQAAEITFSVLEPPSVEELDTLLPGLYELETSTHYDPEVEEASPYTITHVVMEMRYEDYGTKLHVGMAIAGWIPKGVYFDYDNDGQIDTDMAMDFVRDIPMVGRRLAKAYDADSAQNLYSIFVSESENAKYTSVDDMADDAEAASSYIWSFVMDQYETIEAWVFESLSDQSDEE
jgi:hypothetical protein